MKKYLILPFVLFSCSPQKEQKTELPPIPDTPVRMVSDTLYGNTVQDPYRYLEDLKDPEVEKWYRAHADRARMVLDALGGRKELIDQMKALDQRKQSRAFYLQITDNDRYFYLKQTPADETGKLFYRDGFGGTETLLFDPEKYDRTSKSKYVISSQYPSPDGSRIALEVAPNGSESTILLVMDVAAKTFFPEKIDRCWFASCSWLPDGRSFLYNRLQSADVHNAEREKNSKTFLHEVGQDPSKDIEIFSRTKNP